MRQEGAYPQKDFVMIKTTPLLCALVTMTATSSTYADERLNKLRLIAELKLKPMVMESLVIDSVKEQNSQHASLSQGDIDNLDKTWRAETGSGSGDLIDAVLSKPVSGYLSDALEEQQGLISEIFVMDNRGLNVGQSGLTSDYWQGDESKWQETFNVGPDAVHLSEIEFDESSQTYSAQVSISITDPDTNTVIGAATFGVDAEALEYVSVQDLE